VNDPANPYALPSEPPPAAPAGPPRTSGMAVWAMILGLVGIVPCCLAIPSLVGVILGIAALVSIGKSGGQLTGRAMAWIGLVVGLLTILLYGGLAAVFGPPIVKSMKTTIERSDAFVAHLANGEWDRAHELTEPGTMSKEELRAQVEATAKERGGLQAWQMVSSNGEADSRRTDWAKITISYTLTWKDGSVTDGSVVMVGDGEEFLSGEVKPVVRRFSLK
jgi:hypothetical protein